MHLKKTNLHRDNSNRNASGLGFDYLAIPQVYNISQNVQEDDLQHLQVQLLMTSQMLRHSGDEYITVPHVLYSILFH